MTVREEERRQSGHRAQGRARRRSRAASIGIFLLGATLGFFPYSGGQKEEAQPLAKVKESHGETESVRPKMAAP